MIIYRNNTIKTYFYLKLDHTRSLSDLNPEYENN